MAAVQAQKQGGKVDFEKVKCITPVFRLSFPQLHEAKSFNNSEPKYSIEMLIAKDVDLKKPADKQKYSMHQIAFNAGVASWGADTSKWPKNYKKPWRDGDTKAERDGYAGHYYIRASSKKQPGMVDAARRKVLTDVETVFYAGCYCRAEIIAFTYDTAGNKGIGFALQNIQKVAEGEPFSGRQDAAEAFSMYDSVEDTSENAANYEAGADASMGF